MPTVVVSAVRFQSMLANRRWSAEQIAERVETRLDPRDLAREDQPVEFDDLVALGKAFGRPWSYLLSDDVERFPDFGLDNRTFSSQRVPPSPDLLDEYRAAEAMLEAAEELFADQTYEVPPVPITAATPPARAASIIRDFLNVSQEQQLEAPDGFAALRLWVAALHSRGVYVAQRRLKGDSIRAFSRAQNGQAVIVVDTGDTAYARVFSALHEYCHVVLRTPGICDLDEHRDVERYCNEVAAGVLLPDDLLVGALLDSQFGRSADKDDEQLKSLSHHLRVSQAALLIALRDRGTITQDAYDIMEARRQSRRGGGPSRRGGQYYPMAINKVGRRFARNVFCAVAEGTIDRQEAGALIGVSEHVVERFQMELSKGKAETS